MPYPQIHRLVVLGDERVGKTAIIEQLIFGNHVIGQGGLPTIADIYDIVLETEKGTHERLQIFDTPGSLFSHSAKLSDQDHYLLLGDGFILVYEITSKDSYELVLSIRQKIAMKNKEVPVILIGNKCDCNAIREVSTDLAGSWARSYGIKPYEVTVMNRDSLKEPFCYIAWRMANPGRGFSALPLLTSATTKPHLSHHTPYHRDMAQGLGKVDEVHRNRETSPAAFSMSNVTDGGCPEDALFPGKKSGAATLFLGDCLNAKIKPKPDQTHTASNH